MITRAYRIPGTAYIRGEVVDHGHVVWSIVRDGYWGLRTVRMWVNIYRATHCGKR